MSGLATFATICLKAELVTSSMGANTVNIISFYSRKRSSCKWLFTAILLIMASKNSVKIYLPESFYHIYNRGVEKRKIFLDDQDYAVFLSYLQTYLLPKDEEQLHEIVSSSNSNPAEKDKALKLLRLKNYSQNLELVCYVLMPNHFHLLIRQ